MPGFGQFGLLPTVRSGSKLNQKWYLQGGVNPVNCIAAYQPKGAASLSASYINIANPGTYDIVEGVAPGFSTEDGWIFGGNAGGNYLKTGVIASDVNYTYIVAYDNRTYNKWGTYLGGQSTLPTKTITINDSSIDTTKNLGNGGQSLVLPTFNKSGVIVIAGNKHYCDGQISSITIPADDGVPSRELYIGRNNLNGSPQSYTINAKIKAVAIYNSVLTELQINAITKTIYSEILYKDNYPSLSPDVRILNADTAWETFSPHTFSVVEANMGGYKYWGYYGLQQSANNPVGLARSNDLANWVKYESNPIPTIVGRWPSVVLKDGVFYCMIHNFAFNDQIDLWSSLDGINFSFVKNIIAGQVGYINGNPYLYFNQNDNKWYIYWANINKSTNYHIIKVRVSDIITDLDLADSVTVMEKAGVLAAPNLLYYSGKYYLATEEFPSGTWFTNIYISDSPTSGFVNMNNSPILITGEACVTQYIFEGKLHIYYARDIGTWAFGYRYGNIMK